MKEGRRGEIKSINTSHDGFWNTLYFLLLLLPSIFQKLESWKMIVIRQWVDINLKSDILFDLQLFETLRVDLPTKKLANYFVLSQTTRKSDFGLQKARKYKTSFNKSVKPLKFLGNKKTESSSFKDSASYSANLCLN